MVSIDREFNWCAKGATERPVSALYFQTKLNQIYKTLSIFSSLGKSNSNSQTHTLYHQEGLDAWEHHLLNVSFDDKNKLLLPHHHYYQSWNSFPFSPEGLQQLKKAEHHHLLKDGDGNKHWPCYT